jgi:peptidoglycan hydrolase-like protein with peptidoglycan-binding domain
MQFEENSRPKLASTDLETHAFTQARSNLKSGAAVKFSTVKQTTLHLVVALCLAGLVRADQMIQSVQQALKDQGFYYGNVTGDKSAETIAAIRRYQIRNGLQVTGEINPETLRSLNVNPNSVSSRSLTSTSPATQPTAARPDVSSRLKPDSPPRSVDESSRRDETSQAFSGAAYESASPLMSRRMVVAEVKRQLTSRGYYRGRINGRYGHRAASAVRAFQSRSGIPPTGRLDTRTLDALGLSASNLAYLEPAAPLNETWVPVTKFKHGKWKVKWKKYHRDHGDEYGNQDREGSGDDWWHGYGDDD